MIEQYNSELDMTTNNSLSLIARNIKPKSTVLEFGPAYGRLTKYLKEKLSCNVYIVEIDADAANEAGKYACGVYVGDIEKYEWVEKFFDVKFDYAVFADVLEHLYWPQNVLIAVKSLLKFDATILLSVPNIAHNSVIIDMMNNDFEYKDVGLLDRTHIRFFTKHSLDKMLADSYYHVSKRYAVNNSVGENEFINTFLSAEGVSPVAWKTREYGSIYQFVYEAKISTESLSETFNYLDIPKTYYFAQLFLDFGQGFSEEFMHLYNIDFGKNSSRIIQAHFDLQNLGVSVKSFRFDPLNANCAIDIKNILGKKADGKYTNLIVTNDNSSYAIDNAYYFSNDDPQIFIYNDNYVIDELIIEVEYLHFDDSFTEKNMKLLDYTQKYQTEVNYMQNEYEIRIENLKKSLVAQHQNELRRRYAKHQEEINELIKTKNNIVNKIVEAKEKEKSELLEAKEKEKSELLEAKEKEKNELLEAKEKVKNELLEANEKEKCTLLETKEQEKNELLQASNRELQLILLQSQTQVANLLEQLTIIKSSTSWKITSPFRNISDISKRVLRKIPGVRLFYKGLVSIRRNGFNTTVVKTKRYFGLGKSENDYIKNISVLTEDERAIQVNTSFNLKIKFSIIVPLYNTPADYLDEMINSVIMQTYSKWELCLADGSDMNEKEIENIGKAYSKKDKRIIYRKLKKNLGISGNTNESFKMATGNFYGLLDHDDILHPSALYEVMNEIEKSEADFIYTDEASFKVDILTPTLIHFKPDFAVDNLRANNYICHFTCFSKSLHEKVGYFRPECDGSQDYDMVLRLTEQASKIVHIPKVMYFWRAHPNSVAAETLVKPYVIDAAKIALSDHIEKVGLKGVVRDSIVPSMYCVKYELEDAPLISIIIPNKDHIQELSKCVDSIINKSSYAMYEIVIIENNSELDETFNYYNEIKKHKKVRIVTWDGRFNYSEINNYGVEHSSGEYVLFLNNDTEVLTNDWLQEMLMYAQRKDVGAVGAKLYYPNDTIQHAGVVLGIGGIAGHSHKYFPRTSYGYMSRLVYPQNYSAVTGACMMMRKSVFNEVGRFNVDFQIAFNDVDLCMRIRKSNYLIVFTPLAELYHYESLSRGFEDTPEKERRFNSEVDRFFSLWRKELQDGDPYYNPNLTLVREDFSIKEIEK